MLLRSLALLLPLFLSALTSCGPSGGSTGPQPLVIGTDATYPPFEFVASTGELTGVSIDMGKALAQHLGRPVEFKNIAFDGLITALKTQNIDLIISSMTANEERRKSLDFSSPYVTTGLCLLLPKASTVQTAEELKHGRRRVVVKIATTGEQWSRANLPNAEIAALDTDAACLLEVSNGTADAWVYDQISVMNYQQQNANTTRAVLNPIRTEQWAIAMRPGDPIRSQVDAFLTSYRAAGAFGQLADKYMAKERAMMKAQGLPFVFDADVAPK
jgi:polar amino acid transport system substrate-binding protein